jgi:hypothetical protein
MLYCHAILLIPIRIYDLLAEGSKAIVIRAGERINVDVIHGVGQWAGLHFDVCRQEYRLLN